MLFARPSRRLRALPVMAPPPRRRAAQWPRRSRADEEPAIAAQLPPAPPSDRGRSGSPRPWPAERTPALGRLGLLAAYWLGLSVLWGSLTTIVLPRLVERLAPGAVKTTALSAVAALQALVAILVQPVSGAASDRTATPWGRRRPYIVVGVAAQLVFLSLLAVAGSYPAIVVTILLVELASNVAQGPYQGLLPDLVPPGRRGLASGLLGGAQLVGQVVGVAVAGVLAAAGDTSTAIVFAGLAVAFGALATILGVDEPPSAGGPGPSAEAVVRAILRPRGWVAPMRTMLLEVWGRDVLERRDYLWLLASRLAILMATGTLQPFVYFYLEDSIGLGPQASAAVAPLAAVVALVAIASALPGGALTAHWGRVRTVFVSAVCGAIGALLFAVAPSYGALFPIAIPFGIALGVFLSADWALLVDIVPPEESGRYLGLSNTVTAGASVLAVAVGGPLADLVNGWSTGAGYRAVFVLAALEFVVGAWSVTRVPEPSTELL